MSTIRSLTAALLELAAAMRELAQALRKQAGSRGGIGGPGEE